MRGMEQENTTRYIYPIPKAMVFNQANSFQQHGCFGEEELELEIWVIEIRVSKINSIMYELLPEDKEAGTLPARKVMVIADPTRKSAGAVQYALSRVLLKQDKLILMRVNYPNAWKNPFATFLRRPSNSSNTTAGLLSSSEEVATQGEVDFLEEMKQTCEVSQPKLRVHVAKLQSESSNKASVILSQTNVLGIDLLIIGQRRSLSNAILGPVSETIFVFLGFQVIVNIINTKICFI